MILRYRNKGSKVSELQKLLDITITGVFDKNTLAAVIKFQKEKGLVADGIVGRLTWSELAKLKEDKVKPIYDVDGGDDNEDPEDFMDVEKEEENLPVSKHIVELIKLIDGAKITRNIRRLVFHCTATRQDATVSAIQRYWKERLGWSAPGYHIIIKPDGSWTQLQDFNRPSNGVAGINSTTINISYIGGIDSKGKAFDNRTKEQKETLEVIWRHFKSKLPRMTFHGHYEFTNKRCPSFNVEQWIKTLKE
jgi:N-acetylmuramoyl-L-alanine amidase